MGSIDNGGQSKQRFIFSDDYYDQIPLEENRESEVTRKVVFHKKKDVVPRVVPIVHQTNDLDQLVQEQYYDETENMFDFFGHNANTSPVVGELPLLKQNQESNDLTLVNDLGLTSFNPSLQTPMDVISREEVRPLVPISSCNSVSSNSSVDLSQTHSTSGSGSDNDISEPLVDSIANYHANIEPSLDETNHQIVIGDPYHDGNAESDQTSSLPNFMAANEKVRSFNVNSGINQELEKELLEQKRITEEARRKTDPNLQDYLKYVPETKATELLYRAGGKGIIETTKKENPNVVSLIPTSEIENLSVEEVQPDIVNIDEELAKQPQNIQEVIENILNIPNLNELTVPIDPKQNPGVHFGPVDHILEEEIATEDTIGYNEKTDNFNYDQNFDYIDIYKSDLLDRLRSQAEIDGKVSILARYGEDFCSKDYITNPAIGRSEEIKQLILILLTPEKSGILIGKPGIGKTSIVEGLAYQLQRNNVPDALKGYVIVSVKTTSLLGTLPSGETRLQTLIDELKALDKIILFIDEIHMLIGATSESSLDFANMFKESLGRGSIKVIGATTTEEYERYILRDKAFVRRFQKVEVEEPDRLHTIKILMGTLPKIEKNTGAKLKYTEFIQSEIMAFIVDITTEYKRIYGIGSRYPDICLTLLAQAFSQAVFANRKEVTIMDIRNAIENSKNIYPDVIRKELVNFDRKFKDIISEETVD
ncbi:MAG: AAA family ATPase [bacterium]|nr:AAA family ATPase [bacterium]